MLNILDLGFLSLALTVAFTGFVIKNYEKHVPAFIIKGFKYGCFAYQGSGANYLQIIEVPKALYRHFYAFSSVFSAVTLIYALLVYCFELSVHRYVVIFLKLFLEQDEPSVPAIAAIIALTLLTIQCTRRCYETYYLQVFAQSSKMNLSHYVAGLVHYFAVVVAAIGQAPLFCGAQTREKILWSDTKTLLLSIPVTLIFLWAWYEQYKSNMIFANLRRDKKSGRVVTEKHSIPYGRLFSYVSSPHRLCEVIMYVMLLILIPTRTFFCIFLWVICNQVQTSIHAHEWYKNTFKDYPKDRTAFIPKIY
ncbi:polyprenal reductase [Maniola hyperantus]|uniref:polyprenal reductase n=1 Tax=Aphantopus hyperantus TaxID=2795564 RepID=UPI001569A86A|nr:polyprenol reductase [Maniola hyperantus]